MNLTAYQLAAGAVQKHNGAILYREHGVETMSQLTIYKITNLHGIPLAKALREEADDCQNENRALLLLQAAEEIEKLIQEIRIKGEA